MRREFDGKQPVWTVAVETPATIGKPYEILGAANMATLQRSARDAGQLVHVLCFREVGTLEDVKPRGEDRAAIDVAHAELARAATEHRDDATERAARGYHEQTNKVAGRVSDVEGA